MSEDPEDDEIREVEDHGHVTRKEFRDGQIIATAFHVGIFGLCVLILLRLMQ